MHYVLGRTPKPRRWIDDEPFINGVSFRRGAKITQTLPIPLVYTLQHMIPDADGHGPHMPSTLGAGIPLYRVDFIAALEEAGVDNLDYYDAIVKDPDNGKVYTHYKAVNILGLVAAADMAKSDAVVHEGGPIIDVDFDRLVIDDKKAAGFLFFRLLKKGFDDLEFYPPGDIAL
jgi:hypothetical protein